MIVGTMSTMKKGIPTWDLFEKDEVEGFTSMISVWTRTNIYLHDLGLNRDKSELGDNGSRVYKRAVVSKFGWKLTIDMVKMVKMVVATWRLLPYLIVVIEKAANFSLLQF